MRHTTILSVAVLVLNGTTAVVHGQQKPESNKGKPGTYTVGQAVNAHTLMVCQSKDDTLAVADAYMVDDAAGNKKWQELEKAKTVLGEAACGRVDGQNKFKIAELPVRQNVTPDDSEKMTVIKMNAMSGDRTVWAIIFGEFEFVDEKSKRAKSETSAPTGDVAKRIAGLKSKGGSSAWDGEVKPIMLANYDKDRSGEIDTDGEVKVIACDVWRTMDASIRKGDKGSGLAWTYGFKSRLEKGKEAYGWVGDALGINETVRKTAFDRIKGCGIDIGT